LGNVLAEDGLEESLEDDIGTAKLWELEPDEESELEGVVEWEPVNDGDGRFEESEETKHNPVCDPLSIVNLANSYERVEGVVCWEGKAGQVGEELASIVDEDEEEVESSETGDDIDLWCSSLLLEVVQSWVV